MSTNPMLGPCRCHNLPKHLKKQDQELLLRTVAEKWQEQSSEGLAGRAGMKSTAFSGSSSPSLACPCRNLMDCGHRGDGVGEQMGLQGKGGFWY